MPRRRRALLPWIGALATVAVLFVLVRTFVVEAFRIPSGSMRPTLLEGDFLFAHKLPRRLAHGDLVIFESPLEPGVAVVKRVAALAGDTVAMAAGVLEINGVPVAEGYLAPVAEVVDPEDPQMRAWQRRYRLGDTAGYRPTLRSWGPLVVPPDSLFVLGDNRDFSYDSRYWGWLGRDRVEGRPLFIYYSYDPDAPGSFRMVTTLRWGRLLTRPR